MGDQPRVNGDQTQSAARRRSAVPIPHKDEVADSHVSAFIALLLGHSTDSWVSDRRP